MICMFIAGLPECIQELLRASARMNKLTLDEIITRARAIMANSGTQAVNRRSCPAAHASTSQPVKHGSDMICYKCSGINHFAKDCLQGRQSVMGDQAIPCVASDAASLDILHLTVQETKPGTEHKRWFLP